jgi:hypothetical protein
MSIKRLAVVALGAVLVFISALFFFGYSSGSLSRNVASRPSEVAALDIAGKNKSGYLGRTGTSYTGNLGGIGGANAKCAAAFAGSHMCTQSEALRSGATSYGGQGWVACTIYHRGFQGETGPTFFWNACSNATIEEEYDAINDLNCTQWTSTSASQRGPTMAADGQISGGACSGTAPIHCCR